jgi:hypothetical protein
MFPPCIEYSAFARWLHESHIGPSPIVMLFLILMVMFFVKLKHHRYNIVRIITHFTPSPQCFIGAFSFLLLTLAFICSTVFDALG